MSREKLVELLKDGLWLVGQDEYVAEGYSTDSLLLDGDFSMGALADNLIAKGVTIMFESPPCKLIADRPE